MEQLRGASGAGMGQQEQKVAEMAMPMFTKDVMAHSLNPTCTWCRTTLRTSSI